MPCVLYSENDIERGNAMVRTTRNADVQDKQRKRARTAGERVATTGYAVSSEYDAGTDRLVIHFPEITEEERAFRKALVARTLAHRDEQEPLGITSAELIREARAEAYGDDT
jgi:hypothetical protein